MAFTLATGTTFSFASTYGTARNMTALSNATNAVATLEASHGVTVGDFVEITSGWELVNSRIARATAVATNDVTLGRINTSSTTRFPSGGGTGSVREITAWTQILQVTPEFEIAGGDQNFASIRTLANLVDQQIPTFRNAFTVGLPFYFDPKLAFFDALVDIDEAARPTAVRMVFPDGTVIVANGYWRVQKMPTVADSTLRSRADLTLVGEPTVYAAP